MCARLKKRDPPKTDFRVATRSLRDAVIILCVRRTCLQMSLYREAERQRKRRQQRKRGGGKKSSLGAALSASLTALFTGGKDSAASAGCQSDYGDSDYYYGSVSATAADRVEYVTVRGCRPDLDDDDDDDDDGDDEDYDDGDDDGGGELSSGDEHHENTDLYDTSTDGNAYDRTKGLAQMAVALGEFIQFLHFSTVQRSIIVAKRRRKKYPLVAGTHTSARYRSTCRGQGWPIVV